MDCDSALQNTFTSIYIYNIMFVTCLFTKQNWNINQFSQENGCVILGQPRQCKRIETVVSRESVLRWVAKKGRWALVLCK